MAIKSRAEKKILRRMTTYKIEHEIENEIKTEIKKERHLEAQFVQSRYDEPPEYKTQQEEEDTDAADYTLRRQLKINKRTYAFTIHSVIGGNPQDCDCIVAAKHLTGNTGLQQKLVGEGLLNQTEPVFFCGKTTLHPNMPGGLKGILQEEKGMIYSQMRRALLKATLPLTHMFPVFWSTGDTEWKYIGHYQIWDPKEHVKEDEDVVHVAMLDGNAIDIKSPGYRYQMIASLNNGRHGDAWVNALSKKKCGWSSSLTTFQKAATVFYNSDACSDGDEDHGLSAEVIEGYNYLQSEKMLMPDSGTDQQRKEVTRKLLHDGACTLEWEYLKFVKYDVKLHDLLQKKASGVYSISFPSGIRKSYTF